MFLLCNLIDVPRKQVCCRVRPQRLQDLIIHELFDCTKQQKKGELALTDDSSLSSTADYSCILLRRPMHDTKGVCPSTLTEIKDHQYICQLSHQFPDCIDEVCRCCKMLGTKFACILKKMCTVQSRLGCLLEFLEHSPLALHGPQHSCSL